MTAPYPFDVRPLVMPVDPAAAKAYDRAMKQAGTGTSRGQIAAVVGIVLVGIIVSTTTLGVIVPLAAVAAARNQLWATTILLLVFPGLVALAVLGYRAFARRQRERRFRLYQFATANNMTYVARLDNPPLPGMIFSQGRSRMATDIVRGHHPRFAEFGNYQYTTGSGKNETTHRWGYVAVKLDVPLPHIVLDAVGNNGVFGSNLPARFVRSQELSLEGDFDRFFQLYCPDGYEVDALYLFTPDIMARFIDTAAELDVEIVDDWLFFYTKRQASTLDAATWAWLFSAVGAMLNKFAQWARWRDDRLRFAAQNPQLTASGYPGLPVDTASASAVPAGVPGVPPAPALPFAAPTGTFTPPPGVAPPGRRLRAKNPWIVVLIVFGVITAFTFLLPLLGIVGAIIGSRP